MNVDTQIPISEQKADEFRKAALGKMADLFSEWSSLQLLIKSTPSLPYAHL